MKSRRSAEAVQRALELHKRGDLAGAEAGYRAALTVDRGDADAHYLLGVLLQAREGLPASRTHLEQAIALRPGFRQAIMQLSLAERTAGEHQSALLRMFDAVDADLSAGIDDPVSAELRRLLAAMLDGVALGSGNAVVRRVLLRLQQDPAIGIAQLTPAILGLLVSSEAFARLEAALPDFTGARDALATLVADELMLAALPALVVTDERLERVLTGARRWIATTPPSAWNVEQGMVERFASAIAMCAWNGEYVWPVSPAETRRIGEWSREGTTDESLLKFAMYRPLGELPLAEEIASRPMDSWSASMGPIVRAGLLAPREEARLASGLRELTASPSTAVSRAVGAMYQENPYPRWLSAPAPPPMRLDAFLASLRAGAPAQTHVPRSREILVAGCGTGQQSVQLARTFPDASVLAFDISRASLGYAERKSRELGVTNVEYAFGDLLALSGVDARFAIVSCSGVLHHLADPAAGWRRLIDVTAPGGVMKIGLYSAVAREGVAAAKAFVASGDFDAEPEGIRRAREAILALPASHPARSVTGFADFYSTSGFRDLLMHVHERSYRLGEVAELLDALGLVFLGFQLPPAILAAFRRRFPADGADRDLRAWDLFETEQPNTFAAMYQFWCAPA